MINKKCAKIPPLQSYLPTGRQGFTYIAHANPQWNYDSPNGTSDLLHNQLKHPLIFMFYTISGFVFYNIVIIIYWTGFSVNFSIPTIFMKVIIKFIGFKKQFVSISRLYFGCFYNISGSYVYWKYEREKPESY